MLWGSLPPRKFAPRRSAKRLRVMRLCPFSPFSFLLRVRMVRAAVCSCLCVCVAHPAVCGPYPLIAQLQGQDALFRQYSDDVRAERVALAQGKRGNDLPLRFYAYRVKKADTIIRIAARCGIPYDAVASLNRIETLHTPLEGRTLLLPTVPGLYVSADPHLPLERLIYALIKKGQGPSFFLSLPGTAQTTHTREKREVVCAPQALFDGTVRAFFLKPFYRFPLASGRLTSGFGARKSPFTGRLSYHPGIDLAAPMGALVYACASGQVATIAYNRLYGKYVILQHTDGRHSLYGHLSAVRVRVQQKLSVGAVIGNVGSTGASTGPHLHFEVREAGVPQNPERFMEKFR